MLTTQEIRDSIYTNSKYMYIRLVVSIYICVSFVSEVRFYVRLIYYCYLLVQISYNIAHNIRIYYVLPISLF